MKLTATGEGKESNKRKERYAKGVGYSYLSRLWRWLKMLLAKRRSTFCDTCVKRQVLASEKMTLSARDTP